MTNNVNITINGKTFQVPEGMNLIEAAELCGIHIPNLCYIKGMRGIGACRLCLVEIEGQKGPVIACTTKVKEGMVVRTETEEIREIRKFVIDLIVSMHPLDCMTCTKAGVCRLQDYAYEFEIKESSFTRKRFGFSPDEGNPFIKRDPDYCILCGRCVRICKAQGTNVLDFMGRGVGAKVTTAADKPLQESGCTFCGSCIDVCPVNAILEADRWRKGREWDYERITSTCLLCGGACDIVVSTMNGRIMKINASAPEASQERYICAYGRFGYDAIESHGRLSRPMIRINGELREVSWEEALSHTAKLLKKAGRDTGFITTGSILNEDALMLKNFVTLVVKTKNIDSTVSLYGDRDSLISQVADIDEADLIITAGLNPSQWTRALASIDAIIRKKVNGGAKLIVISSDDIPLSGIAHVKLTGNEVEFLKALTKALIDKGLSKDKNLTKLTEDAGVTEAVLKAAELIEASKSPLILSSPALYGAGANLSLIKGKAVSVSPEANAKGVILMGLVPSGLSIKEMAKGGTGLLYVVGDLPINIRPQVETLIYQGTYMTDLARSADVVLPVASYLETEGTIVDYLGRLKRVTKAIDTEIPSHRDIFKDLAKLMKVSLKPPKETEIKKLIKLPSKAKPSAFEKKEGLDLDIRRFIEQINAPVINNSRLLWLKESGVMV
jgi:NADH dehydrogenase/NADH:ubiquinone oxidoreductase subunit G